jgi:hypothetical protein
VNRRSLAVLILVTWLGSVGWLFSRRTGPRDGLLLDDATRTVEPGDRGAAEDWIEKDGGV